MHEFLTPITVPVNASIITITELGVPTTETHAQKIIEFYKNNNRLFKKMDRSKERTDIADLFIERELDNIGSLKTKIRNHVESSPMNDMTITFSPNTDADGRVLNEEFLGIIRFNHTTHKIEYYDIRKIKAFEFICKLRYGKLTLDKLLHYIFNTPFDDPIVFDNHITIIPIVCRVFRDKLEEDEDEQELARTASREADKVKSPKAITQFDESELSVLRGIDHRTAWFGKETRVLIDGNIGIIKNFYDVDNDHSTYFDIEIDMPKLKRGVYVFIKDFDTAPELNRKLGIIQDEFNDLSKTWEVMVDGTIINISYENLIGCHINVGSTVGIHGLKKRTDLNGSNGKIINMFNNVKERWGVEVKGEQMWLSPDNLIFGKKTSAILPMYRENIQCII